MIAPPLPDNEAERIASLRALNILDTPREERFDCIARLSTRIYTTPIAYVAMVDANRQWFKACQGLNFTETGRDVSFCGHAILSNEALIIPDAREDERFHDNPLVIKDPHVRFYAGQPVKAPGGHNIGTLCVMDRTPRAFTDRERAILRDLARQVERELEMVDVIKVQRDLLDVKEQVVAHERRMRKEIKRAVSYVESILPTPLDEPGLVRIDWRFLPSAELAGDFFGYHWADGEHLVVYLLDVAGHGVGSALMSVSVANMFRTRALGGVDMRSPGAVLSALNRTFKMEEHDQMYFTIWYGVFNRRTRRLTYASGGHPPAILMDGGGAALLEPTGGVVGAFDELTFEERSVDVGPEARLYVFSDGIYEVSRSQGEMLTLDDLLTVVRNGASASLDGIVQAMRDRAGRADFDDDVSLVEVRF